MEGVIDDGQMNRERNWDRPFLSGRDLEIMSNEGQRGKESAVPCRFLFCCGRRIDVRSGFVFWFFTHTPPSTINSRCAVFLDKEVLPSTTGIS